MIARKVLWNASVASALASIAALALPTTAQAQMQVPAGGQQAQGPGQGQGPARGRGGEGRGPGGNGRPEVMPYIEAAQVLIGELEPGNDLVTFTQLAVGVDASIAGRNSAGSASLRYDRRIGWEGVPDLDTVSGIARTSLALAPGALTLEAGGMAMRTRVEGNGSTAIGGFGANPDGTVQMYSGFVGPSLQTHAGMLEITGTYQFGYTRVEAPQALTIAPGAAPIDVFDESETHFANVRAGFQPDTLLPVGLGVGAGWNRQDIANLDQQIDDRFVRGDMTVPIAPGFAVVGGLGYEEVNVSSRDALRDGAGNPVIGPGGRLATDPGSARQIAYETQGLIWDVGVLWRPSSRTSLQAVYGRRFGSTTYYGTFAYTPDPRRSFHVTVYDNITGFGGLLTNALDGLGTQFDAFRNPITGDLVGCVGSTQGGNCALAGLGTIRSTVFRARGAAATYAHDLGRTQWGIGAGYDRRRFIAAAGTALAEADGVVDHNFWGSAYVSRRLDRASALNFATSAVWFESGFDSAGNGLGYSAVLSYSRDILLGLSGTAALGLDGFSRQNLPDFRIASALVGLRYTFGGF